MKNEQILDKRWNDIDKYLSKYYTNYKKTNQKTRDKIQDIFNSLDISFQDLQKPISKAQKDRLIRFIEELQESGLLKGYEGYRLRLLLKKKKITYSEYIESMITGTYLDEYSNLESINEEYFSKVTEYSYQQGINDLGIKPARIFNFATFYTMLNIPLLNATAQEYLRSIEMEQANELLKMTLLNIQLGKKLDVDNMIFKNFFNKSNNRIISINKDKISGSIPFITNNVVNEAYIKASEEVDNDDLQVRFIAEMDKRTTIMCETLNNQLFYVNKMNTYSRYSDVDKKNVVYHTQGLIRGENLPPIDNHFHWCRSTITYQIDTSDIDLLAEYNEFKSLKDELNIEIPDKLEEYADLRYNKDGYVDELMLKRAIYRDFKRQVETGTEGERASFQKYYDKYVDSRKIAGTITKDNIRVGDVSPHAIYRMASRDISAKEIIEILNESNHIPDTGHDSLVYTIDQRTKVVLTNTDYHNVKTIMKTRGKI